MKETKINTTKRVKTSQFLDTPRAAALQTGPAPTIAVLAQASLPNDFANGSVLLLLGLAFAQVLVQVSIECVRFTGYFAGYFAPFF